MIAMKELFNPANYFFNPYAIPNIVVGIFGLIMGIFVYCKNKHLEGVGFLLLEISISGWLLGYSVMFSSKGMSIAYFWNKIAYFFVCFISLNNYIFCLGVIRPKDRQKTKILLFGCILIGLFGVLILFTDLIVRYPLREYFWGYHTCAGKLHPIFFTLWILFCGLSFYLLFCKFKDEKISSEKNRFRIFVLAYCFGYIGAFDFCADYGIGLYPFGYLFILIHIPLVSYGLVRYKALGFETIFHKTLLWLISILLIILPIGITTSLISKASARFPISLSTAIFSTILVSFVYYYLYLRPKIDRFFGKEQYAYYELLGRISEKVSTTIDIEELSQKLLNELDFCILSQKICLWLVDEEKGNFYLFATKFPSQVPQIYKERGEILASDDLIVKHLRNTAEVLEPPIIPLNPKLQYLQGSPYFSFLQNETIEVLVPLIMGAGIIGILALGRKRSLRLYSKQDIDILTTLGKELGSTIYNALHHKDIIEKERLDEEMKMGRQIQIALLPQETPQTPGIIIEGLMLPAKEIGGDYYDFIALPNKGNLAVIIGDVSGKGVSAGLIMSLTKATIHNLSEEGFSPKEILLRTNRFLNKHIGGQKFMTLLYLMWQSQAKTLTYSSAGHEHILIYHNENQALEVIQSGGFMLGMIENIETFLEEKQIELQPHDKILLYTDGVTEAENQSRERFGLDRLTESFQRHSQKPAAELMQAVKDEIYVFIGDHPQYDDITLVVMEAQ